MNNRSLVNLEEQSDIISRWMVGYLQLLRGEVFWWRVRPHIPLPAELGGCCLGSAEAGYRNRWLFQARVSPAASYFLLLRVVLVQYVPSGSKKSTFKEHGEHTAYAIPYHVINLQKDFFTTISRDITDWDHSSNIFIYKELLLSIILLILLLFFLRLDCDLLALQSILLNFAVRTAARNPWDLGTSQE